VVAFCSALLIWSLPAYGEAAMKQVVNGDGFSLDLFFDLEDEGAMLLGNFG
jgi:hypothetical protein